MSDSSIASLQIPKEMIESAIRTHVAAAIADAFGEKNAILNMAVGRVINQRVDSEGKPSTYSRDSDRPWIEWAIGETVRESVKSVLSEELAKQQDRIRAEISAQLQKKNSPLLKMLVESMANSITEIAGNRYRMTVNVSVSE